MTVNTSQAVIFGNNVRALRINSNLTQNEVANNIGISVQTLINIEQGDTNSGLFRASDFARFFGQTIDSLYQDGAFVATSTKYQRIGDLSPVERKIVRAWRDGDYGFIMRQLARQMPVDEQ